MTGSGVSQSATVLALAELNQRSAKLGTWDVGVFQPRIIPYTWKDRKTGQHKAGANFKCLLVSLADRRSYMLC